MADDLKRILLVEDEIRLQKITKMALERGHGFDVLACATGREAIDQAADFDPQMILLDIRLPDMDGPTVLATLRELDQFRATPVLFMTANVQDSDIEVYKSLGALDVITKPYDPVKLGARLLDNWDC